MLVGCALLPVGPLGAVKPTEGVADVAKKPDGYVRVTKPPTASAPPAVVVNENVTAAFVLPATRSVAATENEVFVTEPPICPDPVGISEGVASALVETETVPPPVATPMVTPVNVIVTAVLAAIAWVALVMTI